MPRLELEEFEWLAQAVVEFSRYPVATSLVMAGWWRVTEKKIFLQYFDFFVGTFQEISEQLSGQKDELEEMGHKFTNAAYNFLADIEEDHLAAMVLFMPTDFGRKTSAIDVAIELNNNRFCAQNRYDNQKNFFSNFENFVF